MPPRSTVGTIRGQRGGGVPRRVAAIVLGLGFVVVAAMAAAAGALFDAVVEAEGVALLDRPVLVAAEAVRSPALTSFAQAFTALGGGIGMPLLAATVALVMLITWRRWTPVVLIAATAAGSLTLTVVGKAVVGRARPPSADAVPPIELSPSFPSGHTLNAVALAGVVAYLLVQRQRRRVTRIATVCGAAAFAAAIGLTRIYLGVHWLTDVMVAWALGLGWLAVVITAHRVLLTLRPRDDPARAG